MIWCPLSLYFMQKCHSSTLFSGHLTCSQKMTVHSFKSKGQNVTKHFFLQCIYKIQVEAVIQCHLRKKKKSTTIQSPETKTTTMGDGENSITDR